MLLLKLCLLTTKKCGPQTTGTNNQKKNGRQVIYSQITKNTASSGVGTTGSAGSADPPPTFWSTGSSGVRAPVFHKTGSVDLKAYWQKLH